MSPSPYFKQLAEEFEGHPYKDRLLEELEDHLEDFEKDDDLSEAERKGELTQRLFGEVREFKKVFIKIVDPWRNLFFVSEGLMMGVLLAIISFMFYVSQQLDIHFKVGRMLLNLGIIFVIWFFAYHLAFRLFSSIKSLTSLGLGTWLSLMNIPSLILFWHETYPTWFIFPELNTYDIHPAIWIFTHCLILLLSYKSYKRSTKKSEKIKLSNPLLFLNGFLFTVLIFLNFSHFSEFNNIFVLGLFLFLNLVLLFLYKIYKQKNHSFYLNPKALFWFGVVSIFLRTLITYTDLNFLTQHPYLLIPLAPVFLLDALLEVVWFFSNHVYPLLVPIGVLIFAILQSIFIIFRKRAFIYGHFFILTYCLSLFFINTDAFIYTPQFKKDSINISKIIEQDRLSIFYPYFKYFNTNKEAMFKSNINFEDYERNLFAYNIFIYSPTPEKNYFTIEESYYRRRYSIDISQLDDGISEQNIEGLVQRSFDTVSLDDSLAPKMDSNIPNIICGNMLCPNIVEQYSGDKLLFDVSNFVISPDKKWLLVITRKNDFTSGEEVYLIKLH